jgi:ADP-ribosyl-[dinitrogen reductase] hydrolase
MKPHSDRQCAALACLYGALVGDAYGAQLEFLKRPPTHELMDLADTMELQGFLDIVPGQITDDGELTICLLRALISDTVQVASLYHAWLLSSPVDCGVTCKTAFKFSTAEEQQQAAVQYNQDSQANGAIMRVSPIGVVGGLRGHSLEHVAEAAREDARLSHPNVVCQEANAAYAVAIAFLVSSAPSPADTFIAIELALQHCKSREVQSWIAHGTPEIVKKEMRAENIGWVKWSVMLAFHHLRSGTKYEEAIRETCRLGGDTDTNSLIVGALVGAAAPDGVKAIPRKWLKKVLKCTARPDWLQPLCVADLLEKIQI